MRCHESFRISYFKGRTPINEKIMSDTGNRQVIMRRNKKAG